MKKQPTKAERDHMAKVADLGCIICGAPAEIHHIKFGMNHRCHYDTIPLCENHHRHGGFGECIENGKRTFEAKYGTERELLERTIKLLALDEDL